MFRCRGALSARRLAARSRAAFKRVITVVDGTAWGHAVLPVKLPVKLPPEFLVRASWRALASVRSANCRADRARTSIRALAERTRFYSGGGGLERTTWQAGNLGIQSVSWYSYPDMYAHKVYQALVANNNHNDVKYGPVCETA